VQRYDLRRALFPLDARNFTRGQAVGGQPAPGPPGGIERVVVGGLDENTAYYFALRSFDQADNGSPPSNPASVEIPPGLPEAVVDLRVVSSGDTTVTLRWTAPGDDGRTGRPRAYLLRAAESPISQSSFDSAPVAATVAAGADPGGIESATLTGVLRGHRYWVALRAEDDASNRSGLSNVVSTWIGPLAARTGVAIAFGEAPARLPLSLYWQGAGPGVQQEIRIYDVGGRLEQQIQLGAGTEGVLSWDGRDRSGRTVPAGLYFVRLVSGGASARKKVVLLR
jgi:hypothetical protein